MGNIECCTIRSLEDTSEPRGRPKSTFIPEFALASAAKPELNEKPMETTAGLINEHDSAHTPAAADEATLSKSLQRRPRRVSMTEDLLEDRDSFRNPIAHVKLDYWDHMRQALADVNKNMEQECIDYDHSMRRWQELEQKIAECELKMELIEGRFGRDVPERAGICKENWVPIMKQVLEKRLAAERELAEVFAASTKDSSTPLRSLDEILEELERFQGSPGRARLHLVGKDDECARKCLEALAKFQTGVEERYETLLAAECRSLRESNELDSIWSEKVLKQVLGEIHGFSLTFDKQVKENSLIAELVQKDAGFRTKKTILLNPSPGPRAAEAVDELQLRYAAILLQRILAREPEDPTEACEMVNRAIQIFSPRFEWFEHLPWKVFKQSASVDSWKVFKQAPSLESFQASCKQQGICGLM